MHWRVFNLSTQAQYIPLKKRSISPSCMSGINAASLCIWPGRIRRKQRAFCRVWKCGLDPIEDKVPFSSRRECFYPRLPPTQPSSANGERTRNNIRLSYYYSLSRTRIESIHRSLNLRWGKNYCGRLIREHHGGRKRRRRRKWRPRT